MSAKEFITNISNSDNSRRNLSVLSTPEATASHKSSYYHPFPGSKQKWEKNNSNQKDPKSKEDLESLEKSLNDAVESTFPLQNVLTTDNNYNLNDLPPCSLRVTPNLFELDTVKKAADYNIEVSPFPHNYYTLPKNPKKENEIYIPEIPLEPYPENVEFYLYKGVVLVLTPDRNIESRIKETVYYPRDFQPRIRFKKVPFESFI